MGINSGGLTPVTPSQSPTGRPSVRVEFGARTHVGKVRRNNEDQYLIARVAKSLEVLQTSLPPEEDAGLPTQEGFLMLVADGMGGHAGGERASAVAIQEAKKYVLLKAKWYFSLDDPDEHARLRMLHEALQRVNRQIIEEGEDNPALAGMGTTLTAASSIGPELFIVHIGDSRAYLLHKGLLEQLTQDHTMAQKMVERGLIHPADARLHRLRHVLTNSLGGEPGVTAETIKLRLADGDRLLLCTNGLNDAVPDDQITQLLRTHTRPADACQALIDAALDGGGADNITVIVAVYSIDEGV
jgi:protein phosphatase